MKNFVNKGNYSIDNKERELAFEKMRSLGWDKEYARYRQNWSDYPNQFILSDYPLLVDLELASICNLKCPMCYTITEEFKEKVSAKLMDYSLFCKVINEIAGKVPAIRLSLRGESTLHPRFIDCIRYAKEKGIPEVSSLTNGSKLRKKSYCRELVEAGLDWLTVSADGIGETYNRIRKPIEYETLVQGLSNLKEVKAELDSVKPVIKVQSIWPAIQHDPTAFYEAYAPLSDLVAFNPLVDYMREIPEDILAYDDEFSCPMLYQRLVIGADGTVMMCANDEETDHPIGNAYQQTVHEIWHGSTLQAIRKQHKQKMGFKQTDICRRCYMPRKTHDEMHEVSGRPLVVKNYLNTRLFKTSIDDIQQVAVKEDDA